jgi:hypothetical protein
MEATTSNYFDVAVADDKEAELGSKSVTAPLPPAGQALPALEDKAGARLKRIAAAVERGKLEYKSEHAYTEREVGGLISDTFMTDNVVVLRGPRRRLFTG